MNFKKATAFILAFLLLVSNAGLAMTVHYCGGSISSVSSGFDKNEFGKIPEAEKSCCAKETAAKHKSCCSDKVVHFKSKTGDGIVKVFSPEITTPFLIPVFRTIPAAVITICEAQKLPSYYCDAHAPPLYRLYSQYVFYA